MPWYARFWLWLRRGKQRTGELTLADHHIASGALRYARVAVPAASRSYSASVVVGLGRRPTRAELDRFRTSYQTALIEAYTVGALEALKMARGDFTPLPWTD